MARPRTRGWIIGRAAGAPVVVSPGWLLAAAVLTVVFAPTVRQWSPGVGTGLAYAVAGAFVLLLLLSVFLHELAHALVARARGVEVRELAVTLLGGHTEFGAVAPTPGTSAVVAVVGPAVNVALGAAAALAASLTPAGSLVSLLLTAAAVANLFVGLFNLVPGLPLDGGRVLEAAVWRFTGDRSRGTEVAAWVGRAVAVAFVVWVLAGPVLSGRQVDLVQVLWAALVGGFLWSGAGQALAWARSERALAGLTTEQLMTPVLAVPAATVATVADLPAQGRPVVLLAGDGRPAAVTDPGAWSAVPPERRPFTPATAVTVPIPVGAVVGAGLAGRAAVAAVATVARTSRWMAVVADDGAVIGVLDSVVVAEALAARGRRRST